MNTNMNQQPNMTQGLNNFNFSQHDAPLINHMVPINQKYDIDNFGVDERDLVSPATMSKGLQNFRDIEIINDKLGKPLYLINLKIKKKIKEKKKINKFELFLSISDEKDYSIAFTIIQNI